jgi:hypothetical protein
VFTETLQAEEEEEDTGTEVPDIAIMIKIVRA